MKLRKGTLLFLLLTCLAYTTLAQEVGYELQSTDVDIDSNGKITNYKSSNKSIIIPEKIGDITITGIGDEAFIQKSLVAVVFEEGSKVTTIGNDAFRSNPITELSLPTTLTTIRNYAFFQNKIATLTLPTTLTTIGPSAFENNPITELSLPEGLTTIEQYAFYLNEITTLTLPTTLTTIGKGAFLDNDITTLTLPTELTTIEDWAFWNNQITELSLPTALTTIGDQAFQNNQITTLTFPDDSRLESIGKEAFRGNEDDGGNKLTTLTLPPSLESIGKEAFRNNSLTTVTFDDDPNKSNIQSIGIHAFSENTELTGITLPNHVGGTDVRYKDSEGNNYDPNDGNKSTFTNFTRSLVVVIPPHTLTADDVDVDVDGEGIITKCHCTFFSNSIIIPVQIDGKTITGIADKGVFEKQNLVAVAFQEGSQITAIGDNAFRENPITELSLPESLTTIGKDAFRENQITELTLPTALTTIGKHAFRENQITELTLPTALTTIGDQVFYFNKITELTFPEGSQLATIGEYAFAYNQITTLSLPPSLESIGNSAFEDNTLTTVTFDDDPNKSKIQSIGIKAFDENTGLTGIPLPNHVGGTGVRYKDSKGNNYDPNSVDNNTFTNFKISLVAVFPPHTLTADDVDIDEEGIITKCHCTFLSNSIIIPVEIGGITITGIVDKTSPDKGVFQEKNLVTVTFQEGSQITSIGANAFFQNKLTTLTLPTAVTTIGISAFQNNQIAELTLPTALTTIGGYAFSYNVIDKLAFPDDSQLTSIGESVFYYSSIPPFTLPSVTIEGYRTYWQDGSSKNLGSSPTIPHGDFVKSFELVSIEQVTLTTKVEGEQGGTITPSVEPNSVNPDNEMKGMYDINTEVSLTATPDQGWRFDKWVIKGEEKTDNPTSITLDGDKLATAHFVQLVTLTTEVEGQQGGTISQSLDPMDTYDIKTEMTLTATPDQGWRFDKWVIGTEESTDNPTSITLDSDKTATAHFIKLISLTLTIQESGEVDEFNEGANSIDKGKETVLNAIAESGYRFVSWTIGGEEIQDNPYTLPASDTDISVTVVFDQIPLELQVTLTIAKEGEGTISPDEGANILEKDATATLTATPDEGWKFDKWVIGTEEKTDNPTSITMDGDKSVTAHFVQVVTLTTAVAEQQGGTIDPLIDPNGKVYDINTDVELTATPQDGWRFDKWVIGSEDITDNPTSINLDGNKSATAHFVQLVTLTTSVEGEQGGTISATPNPSLDTRYDIKTEVSLTATPADGWKFDKWVIGSEDITDNPTTITLNTDKTATAHFVEIVTLTVKVNNEEGGSIEPSDDRFVIDKADAPSTQELTATPNDGWRFDKWVISDEEDKTDETTTITLNQDKTATAYFVQLVTLTTAVAEQQGGTIAPLIDPNGKVYDIDTEVELTATPNEGWKFDKWEISDEEDKTVTNPITLLTLDKNKSVTAHFVEEEEEEEEAITSILTEVVSATPYPNPVTSQITLKAKDGDLIQLLSPKGKQQYSAQHTGNEVHIIDVSTLPVGVYLVRITDAEGNTTIKRIVKK